MSDFRFANPALPHRVALAAGYGLACLMTLAALWLISGAADRRAAIAEMEAVIARAGTAGGPDGAGLPPAAFYAAETPQLAQAALQTDLQGLAEVHAIEIEVIRADQIEQIDGFVRLNLTLNGIAPEAELGPFLLGLAAMQPIVVIEQLNLRRARTSRTNAERHVAFEAALYGLSQR